MKCVFILALKDWQYLSQIFLQQLSAIRVLLCQVLSNEGPEQYTERQETQDLSSGSIF